MVPFVSADTCLGDARHCTYGGFPLLGRIVEGENRRDGADGHADAAIDAVHRVNVGLQDRLEARTAVVIGCILLGVDAIDGAGIDAGDRLWSRCRVRQ